MAPRLGGGEGVRQAEMSEKRVQVDGRAIANVLRKECGWKVPS